MRMKWDVPHPSADLEIRLINADGTAAEMSGNGTRFVAAYICASQQKERHDRNRRRVEDLHAYRAERIRYGFEIEMGEAEVGAELTVKLATEEVRGIPVSMGNPHYVVFVPEVQELAGGLGNSSAVRSSNRAWMWRWLWSMESTT